MCGGRCGAVWPFLAVLAAILTVVAILPPQWEPIARRRAAEQTLSSAWSDLSISPQRVDADGRDRLAEKARIASAETLPAPALEPSWLPAEPFPVLAATPATDHVAEIVLPDLPPDPADIALNSPGPIEPAFETARRSTPDVRTTPDARDLRPDAFSASESGRTPGAAPADGQNRPRRESIWCSPDSLYAQLVPLTQNPQTAAWAMNAIAEVRRLGQIVDERPSLVSEVLGRLHVSADEADPLAARLGEPALATDLRRAGYALRRRVDVWEQALPLLDTATQPADVDLDRMRLALADVDAIVGGSTYGRAWREYLLIDALQQASQGAQVADAQRRRELSRRVLARVALSPLTEPQSRFLASEPLERLAGELRRMAVAEPDRAALLAALERYEQTGDSADARRLADECLWLGLQRGNARFDGLNRRIAMHYRNANLRVELSESFLNRLMPERLPELAPVRDTVLGNPVRGQSLTATDVAIRFQPDASRLRMALEVSGEVAALTSSTSGPATFQNSSESRYRARKPMELTIDGLTLGPAEVEEVSNVMRLRRLQTSFDGVPLLGALIHGVARNQHDMKQSDVRREVEQKIASRAKSRIDEEADARLGEMSQRLRNRVLDPMHRLSVGPRMVEASTTDERMTMRLRVATARQLGAHTPRPKSPADSLASFHVHQTAVNNFIEQLALDGKTFTVRELRVYLARRLDMPELERGSSSNDNVSITFAERDALRVACQDGRITLDLAIARLSKSPRAWDDFQVRVHYRPRVEGLSAELVRDGVVELPGHRVPSRAQIPLRGIFSKLFAKNQTRQIVPDRLRNEPKLADLAITQMAIEDGWLALAIGPAPRMAAGSGQPAVGGRR
jgi:hypothetical protein